MKKVLITGGHFTPAFAVIEELEKKVDIVFVGRKHNQHSHKKESLEYNEIIKKGLKFHNLATGRITRIFDYKLILELLKIPQGFFQAFTILRQENPQAVLSFGGYLGFPVCLAAYLLNIPIFIHEQTSRPGLTNRLTGFMAKRIFLSFAETAKFFDAKKIIVTGNPVRKEALQIIKKFANLEKSQPIIYVTGGSLGSHSINSLIEKLLPDLLEKYIIIHQTGASEEFADYQRLVAKRETLPSKLKTNYLIRKHFFSQEMGYVYSVSDLIIGRSGANTIFELIAWKKPAILIPLPWSANREQYQHAELFSQNQIGEIFEQNDDSQKLLPIIDKVVKNLTVYKRNFKNVELLYKENAAKNIAKTILSQIGA